jgi:ribosomal protein S18 acetylase RimI-like enzyme
VTLRIVPYAPEHRSGVVALFAAELWPSYTRDPPRTCEALRAPGVTSLVALDDGRVVGIVQVQSDGAIQAHLSTLVVERRHRRRGIGRRLLAEALRAAGGERLDLLSIADDFYASMTNRRFSGWRLTRADLGLR